MICLWISQLGYAQDFSVLNIESSLIIPHQKTILSTFIVKNYTNKNKTYSLFLKGSYSQGGSTALLCYKGACDQRSLQINVGANESSAEIEIRFTGGLSSFKSYVQLEVDDLETLNIITKDIFIEVTDRKQEDIFYSKDDVMVSNFYPNPSTKFANMEYKLMPYQTNAKIILTNVLGSQVQEYSLDPRDNKLRLPTENMSPGIYFYTLFISDEGLATRKLIVKR
jgi:hypothetical protein